MRQQQQQQQEQEQKQEQQTEQLRQYLQTPHTQPLPLPAIPELGVSYQLETDDVHADEQDEEDDDDQIDPEILKVSH